MHSRGCKADSLLPHQPLAPVLESILAPWISQGLDTALRSEDQLPIKKRNAARTITCACIVVSLAIGPRNPPIKDQGESPLLPLPPPLKEVYLFLLLLFLFCLLLLLPLPKSSMRQKTRFRCKFHFFAALQDATWECST